MLRSELTNNPDAWMPTAFSIINYAETRQENQNRWEDTAAEINLLNSTILPELSSTSVTAEDIMRKEAAQDNADFDADYRCVSPALYRQALSREILIASGLEPKSYSDGRELVEALLASPIPYRQRLDTAFAAVRPKCVD